MLDKIMLHNIDGIEKIPMGCRLSRYGGDLFSNLNESARLMARYSCGTEIRFVASAKTVFVTVTPLVSGGDAAVYFGDHLINHITLQKDTPATLTLSKPEFLMSLSDDFFKDNIFGKDVWRIYFHNSLLVLNSIDAMGGDIRPPRKDELPKKTMLAYGSSITHGANTYDHFCCYAAALSRLLKSDILNKGVGGSCFLEKEAADTFAAMKNWDYALLELGVNMIPAFSADEFSDRCSYFLKTMAATGKKIIAVTIFPNHMKYQKDKPFYEMSLEFDNIIRREAEKYENCILIEGKNILTNNTYLCADGIHPTTEGHLYMANNLYNEIKKKTDIALL